MKKFSEIDESLLSKTDSKVSNAKGTAKELVMSDFIHGLLPQLNKTYLGFGSRWDFGSDSWGTPIRPGDLVIFMEDSYDIEATAIGVVASLADKNGCHVVVTGKAGNNTVFFVWMPLSGEFLLSFLSVRIPFAYHFPFPLKILLKALNTRHFVPSSKPKQYCSP